MIKWNHYSPLPAVRHRSNRFITPNRPPTAQERLIATNKKSGTKPTSFQTTCQTAKRFCWTVFCTTTTKKFNEPVAYLMLLEGRVKFSNHKRVHSVFLPQHLHRVHSQKRSSEIEIPIHTVASTRCAVASFCNNCRISWYGPGARSYASTPVRCTTRYDETSFC